MAPSYATNAPTADLTKRNRENTQERLLRAARQIIVEEGMGKVTVASVCQAAGFTRGAFYSNYKDVNQLIVQLLVHQFEIILSRFDEAIQQLKTEAFTLEEGVEIILQAMPLDLSLLLLHMEIELFITRHEEWRGHIWPAQEEFLDRLRNSIEAALEAVGRRANVSTKMLTGFIVGVSTRASMVGHITQREAEVIEHCREVLTPALYKLSEPIA